MKKFFCRCFVVLSVMCLLGSCATVQKSTGLQESEPAYLSEKNTQDAAGGADTAAEPKESVSSGTMDSSDTIGEQKTILQEKKVSEKSAGSENVVDSAVYPNPLQDEPLLEVVIPANSEEEIAAVDNEETNAGSGVPVSKEPLFSAGATAGEDKKIAANTIKPKPPALPEKKDTAVKTVNDTVTYVEPQRPHAAESNTDAEYKAEKSEKEYPPASAEESGSIEKDIFVPDEIAASAQIFSEFPSTEPDDVKEPTASRSVKLYAGQKLEVVYPGEGWIYLGETTAQKGIKYRQRKLQDGLSVFHFDAEAPGNYILNFSYFDVFSDEFIADALSVNVETPKEKLTNTVRAPDYKSSRADYGQNKDLKQDKAENSNSSAKDEADTYRRIQSEAPQENPADGRNVFDSPELTTAVEKDAAVQGKNTPVLSPDEILKKTEQFIAAADAGEALSLLEDFLKNYTVRQDEGWFLSGQAYELNGKYKNIKQALKAYQTLTEAYPESKFWDKADSRIRYIKKFYMDID